MVISFVVAFCSSLLMPMLARPIFLRKGIVDVPNARSLHNAPVIRGMGIAPALGVLCGWIGAAAVTQTAVWLAAAVFAGSLAAAAIGFGEDWRGLAINVRLTAQLAVGLVFGISCCILADQAIWMSVVISLAFAGYVNVANFMDGIDWISSLHGMLAGAFFFVLGGLEGEPWLSLVGGVCAASFAGFLPWNATARIRVFLGDVGSYLLGGLVAGAAVLASLSSGLWPIAIAPLLPYLADTSYTLGHRAVRRQPILQAHRSHIYQRLVTQGWSHRLVAGVVTAASGACCLVGLLGYWGVISVLEAVAGLVLVLGLYLGLPRLRALVNSKRPAAGAR